MQAFAGFDMPSAVGIYIVGQRKMLLPLAGFFFSATFISVMALLVLGISKRPTLSVRTFLAFVIAGFCGGVLFAVTLGRLGPAVLDAKAGLIVLLVGGPIFSTLAGWFGATAVAKERPNQSPQPTPPSRRG